MTRRTRGEIHTLIRNVYTVWILDHPENVIGDALQITYEVRSRGRIIHVLKALITQGKWKYQVERVISHQDLNISQKLAVDIIRGNLDKMDYQMRTMISIHSQKCNECNSAPK